MSEQHRDVGWYVDPDDPRRHRYWNGDDWESQPDRVGGPFLGEDDVA